MVNKSAQLLAITVCAYVPVLCVRRW